MHDALVRLIEHWKARIRSTCKTLFLWEEGLTNFRSGALQPDQGMYDCTVWLEEENPASLTSRQLPQKSLNSP